MEVFLSSKPCARLFVLAILPDLTINYGLYIVFTIFALRYIQYFAVIDPTCGALRIEHITCFV